MVAAKDGKLFSSFTGDCAMKHSVLLMQKVEEVLTKASLSLAECDFFAAVVGAGSFTGIRIGISAVKGFALAFAKPTLSVTSFDVAAYNAIGQNAAGMGKVLCLVDALHGFSGVVQSAQLSVDVEKADPAVGLQNAVCALSEKRGAFGELTALYIRKSSAELNLQK